MQLGEHRNQRRQHQLVKPKQSLDGNDLDEKQLTKLYSELDV
jgi:hypothetical protein